MNPNIIVVLLHCCHKQLCLKMLFTNSNLKVSVEELLTLCIPVPPYNPKMSERREKFVSGEDLHHFRSGTCRKNWMVGRKSTTSGHGVVKVIF